MAIHSAERPFLTRLRESLECKGEEERAVQTTYRHLDQKDNPAGTAHTMPATMQDLLEVDAIRRFFFYGPAWQVATAFGLLSMMVAWLLSEMIGYSFTVSLDAFGYAFLVGTPVSYVATRFNRHYQDQLDTKNLELEEMARKLAVEREKADALLLNILPEQVADQLKQGRQQVVHEYDEASILFADIVDFTKLSAQMQPQQLLGMLNEVFSLFDELVEEHGLEKIKTIGDCYMVAAGVPRPREDHAAALVDLALAMNEAVSERIFHDHRLRFRMGIHSGPVMAGVIGSRKFIYDLWGDTVNVASRMESQGANGRVQVTAMTRVQLGDEYQCEPGGLIDIKGKGKMEVWYVAGRAARTTPWLTGVTRSQLVAYDEAAV